jgi:DNA polymerase-3 subunit epsilon/CBS domain-containing protein
MAAAERVSDGPDNLGATEAAAITALPRVDSYPYRHTIADVMTAPPVTLPGNTRIAEALHLMVERRISSVFVSRAADWGILTERDILRCFDRVGSKAYSERIESFASFPLVSVKPSDRLYVAIGRMTERRIKHLAVIDDRQELVGALTQRDLLRLRAEKALALTQALSDAATVQELADVWHGLADATRALLAEDVDPRDVAAIISGEVCALTARAARMALKAAPQPAPEGLRFAVLVLGSGGRGESMLALDQDNAIIFEGGEVERQYLLTVAARMNAILDEIGVPLCKGKVMASNPQWCHTSQEWRHIVSGWMSRTAPEDVMNADIFFDFCAVHGDLRLADDLRQDAITAASQSESFLKLLSLAAAQINLPLGWFGKFRTDERGRMDLKRGGIMPVFTAARVAALRHGVFERSSLARLSALRGKPDVPQRAIEALAEAHGLLMGAILHQQLDDIAAGTPPSNLVDPKALSALQRDKLKWALEQVPLVRDLLGDPV